MKSETLKIGIGYAAICLIWGSTWMAIRFGLSSLTPLISSGIRFLLAAAFVLMLMKIRGSTLQLDPIAIKLYAFLVLFGYSVPYALVYWAEKYIPSGLTSIVFAVMPLFVILYSWMAFSKESLSLIQIVGSILGFGGIVVIFSENLSLDLSQQMMGILAVLLSAAMQAAVAVAIKKYGEHLNPLSMNFIPMLTAGIILTAAGILFEDSSTWIFSPSAMISIVYLAFFGTVAAFTIYYWLLKKMNIVLLSLSSFVTPIVAVLLGWWILAESFSFQTLMGSALVLIGILFANFRGIRNYYKSKTVTIQ